MTCVDKGKPAYWKVTGSGKTGSTIPSRTLAMEKTAIVLVPEISLALNDQSLHFTFGDLVAIMHSSLSDGEI